MRVDCPYCGKIGSLYAERVMRGQDALTTYYCDACQSEWDEREGEQAGGPPRSPRTRPPKTREDKQSEP